MLERRAGTTTRHPELERLICAAVSNQRFATDLLTTPEQALAHSEHGARLTASERALVISIADARDIYDFAARLHAKVSQPQ